MIPKARSDQLFRKSDDVAAHTEAEEMREELFGSDGTSQVEEDSSVAVCSRISLSRGSSVKKKQPANKERTRRRNRVQYPEDNQFNTLMTMMIERNTAQQRKKRRRKVRK